MRVAHAVGRRAVPLLAPALLLAAWIVATRHAVDGVAQVLVPPSQVWAALRELWGSGELGRHLEASLLRLGIGYGIGAVSGLLFGMAMGISRRFEAIFGPFFNAVRQVPSIAVIPMMILLFGVEETFKIVVVLKASFFAVALATAEGVRGMPEGYREVARVLGLTPVQTLRRLQIPAAVPAIVTGLRIALQRSWMVLVAAELIAAESGLGQMMEMGRQMFRIDVVIVGVLVTGVLGFVLDRSMRLLEARLTPWRRTA